MLSGKIKIDLSKRNMDSSLFCYSLTISHHMDELSWNHHLVYSNVKHLCMKKHESWDEVIKRNGYHS